MPHHERIGRCAEKTPSFGNLVQTFLKCGEPPHRGLNGGLDLLQLLYRETGLRVLLELSLHHFLQRRRVRWPTVMVWPSALFTL